MITEMCKHDFNLLLDVSYELIKLLDASNHEAILEDTFRGAVKPDIITELIMSNHFN